MGKHLTKTGIAGYGLLRNPVNKPGALDDFINLRARLDSLQPF